MATYPLHYCYCNFGNYEILCRNVYLRKYLHTYHCVCLNFCRVNDALGSFYVLKYSALIGISNFGEFSIISQNLNFCILLLWSSIITK